MDSYIVRIYQRDAARLVGVVETTECELQSQVFHNRDELWQILTTAQADTDIPTASGQSPPADD